MHTYLKCLKTRQTDKGISVIVKPNAAAMLDASRRISLVVSVVVQKSRCTFRCDKSLSTVMLPRYLVLSEFRPYRRSRSIKNDKA